MVQYTVHWYRSGLVVAVPDGPNHGQLYVAASRVGNPDNIGFLVPRVSITNVVYTEVLNNVLTNTSISI